MKRLNILVTGSGGVIGTVLQGGLHHQITGYDLPDCDVGNFNMLMEAARGHDAIIHLAWNKTHDDWLTENFNPENLRNAFYVYEAAVQASVPRVIMASSVHADKFAGRQTLDLLKPYALPVPDSPYGSSKCMIEAMGRYYADAKGLEVVCVRFGGMNRADTPPEHPRSERQVWLSQRDGTDLVNRCLEAPSIPGNYTIVIAVSDNYDRLHDYANPFGWQPQDSAD